MQHMTLSYTLYGESNGEWRKYGSVKIYSNDIGRDLWFAKRNATARGLIIVVDDIAFI